MGVSSKEQIASFDRFLLINDMVSPLTKNPGGPVDSVVDAVARRLGATATQVLFAWAKSKGAAIVT